jgi:hypothetical protein
MSIQELQREIESASAADRLYLQALLKHLSRRESGSYREHLTRRAEELERGQGVALDQLKRMDELLSVQGL